MHGGRDPVSWRGLITGALVAVAVGATGSYLLQEARVRAWARVTGSCRRRQQTAVRGRTCRAVYRSLTLTRVTSLEGVASAPPCPRNTSRYFRAPPVLNRMTVSARL